MGVCHEDSTRRRPHHGLRVFVTSWLILVLHVMMSAQPASTPRVLDAGDRSQIMAARMLVARTQAEWDALWRDHLPARPQPALDLSREMAVGVFLGSKPTAGYSVTIVSATEERGTVR